MGCGHGARETKRGENRRYVKADRIAGLKNLMFQNKSKINILKLLSY